MLPSHSAAYETSINPLDSPLRMLSKGLIRGLIKGLIRAADTLYVSLFLYEYCQLHRFCERDRQINEVKHFLFENCLLMFALQSWKRRWPTCDLGFSGFRFEPCYELFEKSCGNDFMANQPTSP